MGYYDAMRYFENLAGIKYCIRGFDADIGYSCLSQISPDGISRLAACMGIRSEKSCRRLLMEEIIPVFCDKLELSDNSSYNDILIAALENRAARLNLNRFRFYDIADFLHYVCSDIADISCCKPRAKKSVSSMVDVFLSVLYHAM